MAERRLYTEEEDEYIRQHYAATPHRIIAAELGRSVKSIRRRSEKLKIPRCKPLRRWTEEKDRIILASKGRPLADVAKQLKRDPSDLLKCAHKLGSISWRRPDGRYKSRYGYSVRSIENGKPIMEHRAVVEECIERKLGSNEIVHHIDTNKRNNDPKNLHLFSSPAEHAACHHTLVAVAGKNANVPELLRMGIIYFDRNRGVYKCAAKQS